MWSPDETDVMVASDELNQRQADAQEPSSTQAGGASSGPTTSILEAVAWHIVSPRSVESVGFLREIDEIKRRASQWDQTSFEGCPYEGFLDKAKRHAKWQMDAVTALQEDLSQALEQFKKVTQSALSGQEKAIGDIRSVTEHLQAADHTGDINLLREVVRTEIASAVQAIEKHKTAQEKLKTMFVESVTALESKLDAVNQYGNKDYLTECASRVALDFYLLAVCRKAAIVSSPHSLAMFDLDDFKSINDTCGHPVGDRVLSKFVEVLKSHLPEGHFLARYGGDEFVAVAKVEVNSMAACCDKAIDAFGLESASIPGIEGLATKTLRASCGVTEIRISDTPEDLVMRADQALLLAKGKGKGQVVMRSVSNRRRAA